MNKIFLLQSYGEVSIYKNGFSSFECINLTSRSPANVLSSDLRKWANSAKHGDVFHLRTDGKIICIDLSKYE